MSKSLRTLKVVIPDGNPLNYKQVVGGSDCVMHVCRVPSAFLST